MSTETYKLLYSGKDLQLREFRAQPLGNSSKKCIITFTGKGRILDPQKDFPFERLKGFAENVFTGMGIDEIHVISNKCNWYQTNEMLEVIKILKNKIVGKNCILYGSSMGGFAAINFSQMLGLPFLAFAPQASLWGGLTIQASWKNSRDEVHPIFDNILGGEASGSFGYIFFDKFNEVDSEHVNLILKKTSAEAISINFSGHETIREVNNVVRVKSIVREIFCGNFDLKKFKKYFYKKYNVFSSSSVFMNYLDYTIRRKQANRGLYVLALKHAYCFREDLKFLNTFYALSKKIRDYSAALIFYMLYLDGAKRIHYTAVINSAMLMHLLGNTKKAISHLEKYIHLKHYAIYGNLAVFYSYLKDAEHSEYYKIRALDSNKSESYAAKIDLLIKK